MSNDETTTVSAWQVLLEKPEQDAKFSSIRNAANLRQKDVQKRMEKTLQTGHRVEEAVRARKKYSEVRNMISHSKIVTKVERNAEEVNVSYRDQGNVDMYNEHNMHQREANKRHPDIQAAIRAFWNSLPKLANGKINKQVYVWMCRKMFFKLVGSATEDEFQLIVQEDWKNDALWSHYMTERMFSAAIFTTADTWCETTNPAEYVDFVHKLQEVVASGEAFKGPLDNTTDEEVRERRHHLLEARRRRAAHLGAGALVPGHDEAIPEDLSEVLQEEEKLDDEQFQDENEAWYDLVMMFFDAAAQECVNSEELTQLLFERSRVKRLKVMGDLAGTPKQEAQFLQEVEDNMKERVQQREDLANQMKKYSTLARRAIRGRSHRERMANRSAFHRDHMDAQEQQLGVARDILSSANDAYSEARQSLRREEGSRLKTKASLDPYSTELNAYLEYKAAHVARKGETEENLSEDTFTEFIAITRNLHDARELCQLQFNDPLFPYVLGVDDHEDEHTLYPGDDDEAQELRVKTSRWVRVVQWFQRNHVRRNEFLDDMLDNLLMLEEALTTRDQAQLATLHQQQAKGLNQRVAALQENETLTEEQKAAQMKILSNLLSTAEKHREEDVESLRRMHAERSAAVNSFKAQYEMRVEMEKNLERDWKEAKSFSEIVQFSGQYWELLRSEQIESTLAATTYKRQETMELQVSMGGTVRLPPEIKSLDTFVYFMSQEEEKWLAFRVEQFASLRHSLFRESGQWAREIEAREDKAIADWKLQVRSFIVETLNDIKLSLASPKCPLSLTGRHVAKARLEKADELKAKLTRTTEWHHQTLSHIDELDDVLCLQADERRLRIAKIFALERVHRLRFLDREALRARHAEIKCLFDRRQIDEAEREGELNLKEEERARTANEKAERIARRAREEAERRQQEAARKAEELRRMEELEKAKKASLEKERMQLQQEKRRKNFEEQQRRQKERQEKERQEKARWREQFLEEERRREKQKAERDAWKEHATAHRTTSRGSAKPSGKVARRKSQDAGEKHPSKTSTPTPSGKDEYVSGRITTKKTTPLTPARQTKILLEEQLSAGSFGNLNNSAAGRNAMAFEERRSSYLASACSNKEIYKDRCRQLGVTPDAEFAHTLSEEELVFSLSTVTVSGRKANIASLLDVLLMNPVQRLYLKKAELSDGDVKSLCEALRTHHFISYLDLKNNKELTNQAADAILALLDSNRYLVTVEVSGTSLSQLAMDNIKKRCERNAFARSIGKTDFEYISQIFREMDRDGSGSVDLSELRAYSEREKAGSPKLERSRRPSLGVNSPTIDRIQAKLDQRVGDVKEMLVNMDKNGDGSFSLAELICFIFPHWTMEDAEALIDKYSAETAHGPSLKEMQEFVDTFGSGGTLTLQQLAKGLGESSEALRTVFLEYDVDNDGRLNIDEFIRFMSA